MLTDDGKHLYVSWDEYHLLIERLALKVAASGWAWRCRCTAVAWWSPAFSICLAWD